MNQEIPPALQDFDFAEIGNNQQNIWRLRDELNATRRWLRENTVNIEEEDESEDKVLKEGVTITKNGKYYMKGKGFIKEVEAFL